MGGDTLKSGIAYRPCARGRNKCRRAEGWIADRQRYGVRAKAYAGIIRNDALISAPVDSLHTVDGQGVCVTAGQTAVAPCPIAVLLPLIAQAGACGKCLEFCRFTDQYRGIDRLLDNFQSFRSCDICIARND